MKVQFGSLDLMLSTCTSRAGLGLEKALNMTCSYANVISSSGALAKRPITTGGLILSRQHSLASWKGLSILRAGICAVLPTSAGRF